MRGRSARILVAV